MADTQSMLKIVAKGSQCEGVEKWGQSASPLPPSQAVGDDTGREELPLRKEVGAWWGGVGGCCRPLKVLGCL